jgi:hypothetical protein
MLRITTEGRADHRSPITDHRSPGMYHMIPNACVSDDPEHDVFEKEKEELMNKNSSGRVGAEPWWL